MKPYPLRRTVQALSSLVLVMVCVHFGANPARAAEPDATPVVIRYLNDPGFVPSFVIADALGFLKGTGVHLESGGTRRVVPRLWPLWRQARSMWSAPAHLR